MGCRQDLFSSLLELFFPEHCTGCSAPRGTMPWCVPGQCIKGLRPWDGPHLCAECFATLQDKIPAHISLDLETGISVPVLAAQWTNVQLVEMIGQWKYKGVRGLVWPLSNLLIRTIQLQEIEHTRSVWIPMPLHRRRQRERGFNQAQMLAEQLAATCGGAVRDDWVIRQRRTGQQAKLSTSRQRLVNMQGAFNWENSQRPEKSQKIYVVDDLVTTGATVGSLVQFLREQGYQVEAIVCLGVAKPRAE